MRLEALVAKQKLPLEARKDYRINLLPAAVAGAFPSGLVTI